MNNSISEFKGYQIKILGTPGEFLYSISKNGVLVYSSPNGQTFFYSSEAEVQAKIEINRLTAKNEGWIVS